MLLKVLEIMLFVIVIAILISQVVIPLWNDRRLFSAFRKETLSKTLVEVNELADNLEVSKTINKTVSTIKKDLE